MTVNRDLHSTAVLRNSSEYMKKHDCDAAKGEIQGVVVRSGVKFYRESRCISGFKRTSNDIFFLFLLCVGDIKSGRLHPSHAGLSVPKRKRTRARSLCVKGQALLLASL